VGGLAPYALFFLAGLGFGYAAVGRWMLIPFVFPLALALGAMLSDGPDATMLLHLLAALLLSAGGIALGALVDSRAGRREHSRYA
jgi:hypothetical protein